MIVVVIPICVVIFAIALALALGVAAKDADELQQRSGLMGVLASLRSPSGQPFFASSESVDELADVLESTRSERVQRR